MFLSFCAAASGRSSFRQFSHTHARPRLVKVAPPSPTSIKRSAKAQDFSHFVQGWRGKGIISGIAALLLLCLLFLKKKLKWRPQGASKKHPWLRASFDERAGEGAIWGFVSCITIPGAGAPFDAFLFSLWSCFGNHAKTIDALCSLEEGSVSTICGDAGLCSRSVY